MTAPIPTGEFFSLPPLSVDNESPYSALCDACRHDGVSKCFCATCKAGKHFTGKPREDSK